MRRCAPLSVIGDVWCWPCAPLSRTGFRGIFGVICFLLDGGDNVFGIGISLIGITESIVMCFLIVFFVDGVVIVVVFMTCVLVVVMVVLFMCIVVVGIVVIVDTWVLSAGVVIIVVWKIVVVAGGAAFINDVSVVVIIIVIFVVNDVLWCPSKLWTSILDPRLSLT